MKKTMALILSVVMIVLSMANCFAAEEPAILYSVVTASPIGNYCKGTTYDSIYGISSKPVSNYNFVASSNGTQMILGNYDLTNQNAYDIQKVEIIADHTTGATLHIYEVTGTWTVSNGTETGLPEYEASEITTKVLPTAATPATTTILTNQGYPSVTSGYENVIDITSWVLTKLANGDSSFGLLYKSTSNSLCCKKLDLLVTYKDNIKPIVSITAPNTILPDADANFAVTVTDTDSISSVAFTLDDETLTTYSGDNGSYTVTVPASKMTLANHTLTAIATDSLGAVSKASITFHPEGIITKYVVSPSTAIGNYVYKDSDNIIYDSIYSEGQKPFNKYNYITKPSGDEMILGKYDLSNQNAYDIQKVEIITDRTLPATLQIYEVTGSWTVSDGAQIGLPTYDENIIITTVLPTLSGTSDTLLIDQGYPNVTSGYEDAIDITSWVLPKLANGKSSFSLLYKSTSGWMYAKKLDLFVTYKENLRPNIVISQPQINGVAIHTEFDIVANITDSDGSISSCEVQFDNTTLSDAVINGSSVTATVPALLVTEGEHTIKITAVDDYNAVKIFTFVVKTCQYYICNRSFTDGNGGVAQMVSGNTIASKVEVVTFTPNMNITAIIVVYDADNAMQGYSYITQQPVVGVNTILSPAVVIPAADDLTDWSVKAFIWDDFSNLSPLDDFTKM